MSGNICRETYFNYGSYLRSRGYDKAICDLIDMIESGKIPFGPFRPMGECNAQIAGNLDIVPCPPNVPSAGTGGVNSGMGQLWVQGGYGGTSGAAAITDLGIQSQNGLNNTGPIIQTGSSFKVNVPGVGPLNDQNYLESNTYLDGGLTMNAHPSSTGITTIPPLSKITDIVNSTTAPAAAWASGGGFPNDYTLATTASIKDYVSSLTDPKLKYIGNTGSETVDLSADIFNIVGATGTIKTAASGSSPNPLLKIDLVDILTPSQAGSYGSQTVGGTTQSIKVPTITIDQKGRVTSASELTAMEVMSSFNVVGGTASFTVKNTNPVEFVNGPNLKLTVASGPKITYGLATTLTGLTDVKTNALTIPSGSGTSITTITSNANLTPLNNQTLATTDAIELYVNNQINTISTGVQSVTSGSANTITVGGTATNPEISANTGSVTAAATHLVTGGTVHTAISALMTDWKLEADTNTPSGTATISNNNTVKINGDGSNINTNRNNKDITVSLNNALSGIASINASGTGTLELSKSGDTTTVNGHFKADDEVTLKGVASTTALNAAQISAAASPGFSNLIIDNSNGRVYRGSKTSGGDLSSLRYKENVEIMTEEAAADLMKIMPRTFNYKGSNDETFGLIAEELAGTELKAAVANDNEGRPDSINYSMLVAPLLRIVQDQNERIKALEEKVEALSK